MTGASPGPPPPPPGGRGGGGARGARGDGRGDGRGKGKGKGKGKKVGGGRRGRGGSEEDEREEGVGGGVSEADALVWEMRERRLEEHADDLRQQLDVQVARFADERSALEEELGMSRQQAFDLDQKVKSLETVVGGAGAAVRRSLRRHEARAGSRRGAVGASGEGALGDSTGRPGGAGGDGGGGGKEADAKDANTSAQSGEGDALDRSVVVGGVGVGVVGGGGGAGVGITAEEWGEVELEMQLQETLIKGYVTEEASCEPIIVYPLYTLYTPL